MAVFDNSGRKVETSVFGRPQILPHIEPKTLWLLGCSGVTVFDNSGRQVETSAFGGPQILPHIESEPTY